MLLKLKKKRGQSTLEYAVLVVIIIAALLTVQKYVKRAVSGSLGKSADDISETQFDPYLTVHVRGTNSYSHTNEIQNTTGTRSTLLDAETTNTTENMWFSANGQ